MTRTEIALVISSVLNIVMLVIVINRPVKYRAGGETNSVDDLSFRIIEDYKMDEDGNTYFVRRYTFGLYGDTVYQKKDSVK